ncbi:MAG: S-layer homology domain-containing protein [Clostridia bacterium]|nr:S-layer homology domain-containing protein [Clostridia bacterium]
MKQLFKRMSILTLAALLIVFALPIGAYGTTNYNSGVETSGILVKNSERTESIEVDYYPSENDQNYNPSNPFAKITVVVNFASGLTIKPVAGSQIVVRINEKVQGGNPFPATVWLSTTTVQQRIVVAHPFTFNAGEIYSDGGYIDYITSWKDDPLDTFTVQFFGTDLSNPIKVDSGIPFAGSATAPPVSEIPTPVGKHFSGWDKDFSSITSDLSVYALYDWNTYDVSFFVYGQDDPFYVDTDVQYGHGATAPSGPYPAPEGKHFDHWDVDFSNVTSDLEVHAVYEWNLYDVSFYGEEENPFYIDSDVQHGTSATDPRDADPAVAIPLPDGKHFVSWDKTFNEITSDLDVNAIFDWNTYDVTFIVFEVPPYVDEDVVYNTSATPPDGPYNAPEGKHFTGWDVDFSHITGELTVTALYDWNTYDVTFLVYGEDPFVDEDVVYNTSATPPDEPYNAPEGKHFTGWDVDFSHITGDLTVTALYDWNVYKVNFVVPEGAPTAPATQDVKHGDPASDPLYGDDWTDHEFKGWMVAGVEGYFDFNTEITSDTTLYAVWDELVYYTVTFHPENGDSDFYEVKLAGGIVNKPTVDPVLNHFIFDGWEGSYVFGEPLDGNYDMYASWIFNPQVIITENPEADPVVESDGLVLRIGYNRTVAEGQGQLYYHLLPDFRYYDVEWSVVSGDTLVSVDQNGFVQGLNPGTATIQVTVYYYPLQETETENDGLLSITDTVPVQVIKYYPPSSPNPTPDIIIEEEPTPEGGIIIDEEETPLGAIEFYMPYVYGYPDQSFGPTRPVTRAEVATMFAKILNMNFNYPGTPKFNDVDPNAWYYTYVQAIGRTNIFVGTGDGKFMPDQPITRSELATVFAKFLTYTEIGVDTTPVSSITDVTSNYWASPYIYAMYNSGLMVGYPDGSYKPFEYTQRDHVVQMINKLINRPQYFPFFTKYIDITTDFWAFGDIEAATTPFTVQQELPVDQ